MEQKDLKHIVDQFEIQGNVTEVKPLGNGLINTTYKVCTEGDAPDYVLQHVNNAIFPDVKMLMDNIVAVTGHIRKKLEAANTPDIDRKVLTFIPAKDGQFFYLHEGKYWRIMVFIPDTVSQTAVTPETSYIVGETFGNFQAMLADIPVQLGETIKDFHNMEFRMQQLREAVAENKAGRLAVQGIPVCFDAKECHTDTFPLANVHAHQIQFMQDFENQQGISFILIFYTQRDEFYYMPFRQLYEFWERAQNGGRKSFRLEELNPEFFLPKKSGILVPYLEGLKKDLELRD